MGSISTLAFDASHEARRRMAVFSIQLTRKPHRTSEPRGPSPSGGISQSSHMSPYAPARRRRAVRGQGVLPLARGLSPSGGISQSSHMFPYAPARPRRSPGSRGTTPCASLEACRRAAVFRSQVTCLPTPLRAAGAQSGVKGYYPLREACRRAAVFRSQLTCLPTPLRAAGAQSERGTQSPILPRTMKRAPSKV